MTECPVEVDWRGSEVVIAFDDGERLYLEDVEIDNAYRLADELVHAADHAADNAGLLGSDAEEAEVEVSADD